MKCCVCNREWPDSKGHTVTLTEAEKQHIASVGVQTVPDAYHYCGPCWKVLSDKTMGAQLIKGTFQSGLTAKGVERADLLSHLLFRRLIGLKPTKE